VRGGPTTGSGPATGGGQTSGFGPSGGYGGVWAGFGDDDSDDAGRPLVGDDVAALESGHDSGHGGGHGGGRGSSTSIAVQRRPSGPGSASPGAVGGHGGAAWARGWLVGDGNGGRGPPAGALPPRAGLTDDELLQEAINRSLQDIP
jgi:hypothetical protein